MIKMTAVSLFAGVGGFDLALERNGVEVVASVEIDKHARGVLERRFPTSKLFNDVKEVTGNDLRDAGFIPEHGIITGGFPCQDLSVAGKRAGFAGQRSSLFYEIARIADETKAKWLVLENVPGLLTSQRGADMGAVVGTLADLGYCVGWRVLDAQHFGVPQRRRRVFIVAERAGNPTGPAKVLFEPTSLRGDSASGGTPWQETAGSTGQGTESAGTLTAAESIYGFMRPSEEAYGIGLIENGVPPLRANAGGNSTAIIGPVSLYEPHHGDGRETVDRANTLNARMGTGGNNLPVLVEPEPVIVGPLTALGMANAKGTETTDSHHYVLEPIPIQDGRGLEKRQNGLGIGAEGSPSYTLDATGGQSIVEPTPIQGSMVGRNDAAGPGGRGYGEAGGPMFTLNTTDRHAITEPTVFVKSKRAQSDQDDETWKEDGPHPTVNQFDVGDSRTVAVAVTQSVRRLTPMECERLQGFPDGWTEGQADSHRYKQMGNAVAVPVVQWIIRNLVKVEND